MQKRTYLTITPESKPEALRAAGRHPDGGYALEYEPQEKLWYAREGANLEPIKAWLPENVVTGLNSTSSDNLTPAEEFAGVLQDAGFILPGNGLPEMDGKRHRIAIEGGKPGNVDGVYQGFLDGRPAGWYQNHRASEGKVNWTSTGSHTYDPAEAIKQRAQTAQKRWDREMQSQADFAAIATRLESQWARMPPAPDTHAYLARKGVPAVDGVRLDKYDNLVIPLSNTDGTLRTLQYIKPDGTKNLKKGAEKTGNFFVVGGELSPQRPVLYAEGYATAASLHLATGLPVVMTVDAGNLVTVSRKLKERFPDTPHIVLGEDDFTKKNAQGEADNKGTQKALEAAEAIRGIHLIPIFTESERAQAFAGTASFSDFNDIHVARGLDAVRDQLAPVLDHFLPDWRQAFTETHSMPDNDIRPEEPAIPLPDITDYPDFGADFSADFQEEFPPPEDIPDNTSAPEPEPTPETAADNLQHTTPPDEEIAQPTSLTESVATNVPEMTTAPEPTVPGPSDGEHPAEPSVTPDKVGEPNQDEVAESPAEPPLDTRPQQQAETTTPGGADTEQPAAPSEPENGFSFTFGRLPGDVSPEEAPVPKINLDELLQGLTSRQEDRTWIYALDGEDAFRDYGDRIVMATPQASENDRMVLAALLSAKANQRGAVEITGSDDFIQKTLTLIADHNIDVHLKNPQQREQFEALMKARAAESSAKDGMTFGQDTQNAAPAAPTQAPGTPETPPAPGTENAGPAFAKPTESAAPDMSVFEKETLRTGLTGKLLDSGRAPYQFDKANTESFYIQLRTKVGNKTFWGVELAQALKDSGQKNGDIVKLQYLGQKPVTVNVPIKDIDGVVTGYERQEKHRNHWSVTPGHDNRLLVADRHVVAPADLSAYDGNAFWQLQHQVVQAAALNIPVPETRGHGLLYTGPDGEGRLSPQSPPENVAIPAPSKAAGSVMMHATGEAGELLAHLVKGHGDYLQGVMRHEGELRHVLARVCTGDNGNTWLAVNSVTAQGALNLIGHGSAVNAVKNGEAKHDTFAFQLKGKDAPKFAVPLVSPEKIPPALHSKLGFDKPWTPPKVPEPEQAPRAQAKPANQPQPM